MCGITGILNLNHKPTSITLIQKMNDAIMHRGPDGEGIWCEGPIGLGHRRLAIIDLSAAGHQPMCSRDGRYVISYNGEIYNFRELRTQLEANGYLFHTKTDSEVVLNSFIHWGLEAIKKFNGMFAFAIWDKHEQTLTLARDRYGIKPLYYIMLNNSLIFASEIKALLTNPDYSTKLNKSGLIEYFTFQNFFTNNTLFDGIEILPAGHYGQFMPGVNPSINKYWDFNFHEPATVLSENEYLEQLDYLFQQAVSRQLVSDVEIGAYLSGGIDSGSITSIASKQLVNMTTFTCGFDLSSASGIEINFDERSAAEQMSYQFKTEHYEMVLKAGDMERSIRNVIRHLENPRVGQSYPNYYISRLASKFVKVVLAGTGGDELFGGYPWRYYRAMQNTSFPQYIDNYYNYWQRLLSNSMTKKVFSPIWHEVQHVSTRDIFFDIFPAHANQLTSTEDYINHSLYLEAKTFLHGLLVVEDKLSMAHGLETRVPFLDNDLVDFAMRLPVRFKVGKLKEIVRVNENQPGNKTALYFQKTNDGKLLLRKMMQKYVPTEVINRQKQGFSAPDASWFQGDSIEYVKSMLLNKRARIYDFLDFATVSTLINTHLSGAENRRLLIWSLLSFENWCREFMP